MTDFSETFEENLKDSMKYQMEILSKSFINKTVNEPFSPLYFATQWFNGNEESIKKAQELLILDVELFSYLNKWEEFREEYFLIDHYYN